MYNKIEKTHFVSINQLPNIQYSNTIFNNLTTFDKDGFALKKLPPLYIKTGQNMYSRVLYQKNDEYKGNIHAYYTPFN